MKFNQVNEFQIQQANDAIDTIQKLRKTFAKQKLVRKIAAKYVLLQG